MSMHASIYIRSYVYVHMQHSYMHTLDTRMYVLGMYDVYAHVLMDGWMDTYTCMHPCTYVHTYTSICSIRTCICSIHECTLGMYDVYAHVWMDGWMDIYIYARACIHVHTHIRIHAYATLVHHGQLLPKQKSRVKHQRPTAT
jgi:hypothetical protein